MSNVLKFPASGPASWVENICMEVVSRLRAEGTPLNAEIVERATARTLAAVNAWWADDQLPYGQTIHSRMRLDLSNESKSLRDVVEGAYTLLLARVIAERFMLETASYFNQKN
jgi:hypothetical protein